MKTYFNILFNLLASLFIAVPITNVYGGNVWQIGLCIFCAGLIISAVKTRYKVIGLFMALQKEIWESTIEEEVTKDNTFINYSRDASNNVMDGKVVHIPQSGGSGNVEIDRTVKPAAVRKRTDTDVVYVLREFTSDPVEIPNADKHELSYDKRVSVLGEDLENLKLKVAEGILENWTSSGAYGSYVSSDFPASQIIEVTGENGTNNADAEGATGNRKTGSRVDLQIAQKVLRTANRWTPGKMNAMLTPQTLVDMYPANDLATITLMNQVTEEERRMGILMKDQGWNIMTRSSVLRTNAAGTVIKYDGVAGDVGDHSASLLWNSNAVERAIGEVKLFQKIGDPQWYADIYSMLVRMGGRARRSDYLGMLLLRQTETD